LVVGKGKSRGALPESQHQTIWWKALCVSRQPTTNNQQPFLMNPKPRLSYYSFDSLGNPWVSGGGAVRDFEVLKRFARHTEVTLYTARFPGFREETRGGVRVRGLGFGGRNWLCRLTFALAANLRVLFDSAALIGNSASIYAPVLTGLLRPGRFYAVYHHHVGPRSVEKFGLAGWVPRLLEAVMLRFGKRYVISNATLARKVSRLNPRASVFTTFNGFDAGLLALDPLPSARPFVLFVGRFDVYMKGLDLLIPAWAATLAEQGIDLVLAGRAFGADLEKVRVLVDSAARGAPANPARGEVRLELDVPEARKAELLAGCLFFASPSRFEGFGIAALEANAAGRAVLATDTDGFRDSLALGETALAIPVEDPVALREGLRRLAADAALRDSLGRRGRARAAAYSWDAIAEKEWGWIRRALPRVPE
jgi:glycosyltransferase involved in cell wall biosynthesis